MIQISETEGGVSFRVWAQPGARATEPAGEREGALKLKIAAPPVGGKANRECVRFLAKLFGVSASEVEIRSGHSSRTKTIRVSNVDSRLVRERLGL